MVSQDALRIIVVTKEDNFYKGMNHKIKSFDENVTLIKESHFDNFPDVAYDGIIVDGNVEICVADIVLLNKTMSAVCARIEQFENLSKKMNGIDLNIDYIQIESDILCTQQAKQFIMKIQTIKENGQSAIYLDALINSIPDLVWFKDLKGSHLKVNKAFGKAVGKTVEQCLNRGHYYIWDIKPADYSEGEYVCLETEEEVIRLGKTCLFDEKVLSKNGLRQFKTYKSPLYDANDVMFGTVGIAKDVTDLQNISRELEVILQSIPFAALIVDEHGNSVYSNTKFSEYFSISRDHISSMSYSQFTSSVLSLEVEELEVKILVEVNVQNKDGLRVFRIQQQNIIDIFGNHFGYFFIALDVTNETILQQHILHSANTDFLTNLNNRRFLYEKICEEISVRPICVVYFDLDKFKHINDTYGHQEGDRALVLMARLLETEFSDAVVARVGGDEFVVAYFEKFEEKEIEKRVNAFILKAGGEFKKSDEFKELSTCAGIACSRDDTMKADALILQADDALYEAKSLGRGKCVLFSNEDNRA